ncbi:hypothetical protein AgCh_037181 [Apium graveolens]
MAAPTRATTQKSNAYQLTVNQKKCNADNPGNFSVSGEEEDFKKLHGESSGGIPAVAAAVYEKDEVKNKESEPCEWRNSANDSNSASAWQLLTDSDDSNNRQ